ncbi:NAD(P)-dependent alcohol dehydrogenase [Halopelagius longus]|uniref:Aryl-alcohol dehydrogenase n=1 Tax=Halopelagius longus TaxID=1236180 RepID=A0A1H0YSE2_9EURY|nr:NAD(P)-dependent alcohol dehydrogenase [Halopelagius longus]RDI72648.1 NAD(P)-dependent alcohol dehydrogenase [Halopelagius longus]SDQ17998.1 aryl-alcohol dehydrogenase [Halopelagius longus]
MEIEAAVVEEEGGPFDIETVELDDPQANEVVVRVVGAGVCHTDMIVRDQWYPTPLPAVLGHEGSGVVEEVGANVASVEPGDRVVMSFDADGRCPSCRDGHPAYCEHFYEYNFGGARPEDGTSPISRDGEEISGRFFGQSSFATHAVATERNVVPVEDDVPLELLGPLGCGIQTGAGAVINSLDPQAGSSIVVFGAGSVGLSAVMAADIKGCTDVVVVELRENRLEKAAALGATETVNPDDVDDVVETVRQVTDGGVEYALETTGVTDVAEQAVETLTQRGTLGIAGAPPLGAEASFDVNDLILNGRSVTGIVEGDSSPREFIPDLVELYRQGKFPFDELVTYYDFEEIEQAVEDSENGDAIKPVLRVSEP